MKDAPVSATLPTDERITRAHVEEAIAAVQVLLAGVAAGLPLDSESAKVVKRGLSRAGESAAYWLGQAAREVERGG